MCTFVTRSDYYILSNSKYNCRIWTYIPFMKWSLNVGVLIHVIPFVESQLVKPWNVIRIIILTLMWEVLESLAVHGDVIKWKHFPRYWPFVRGIHRSPVNTPHRGQWRGAVIFSGICAWINGWVNIGETGDLRHHRVNYDVTVMDILSRYAWMFICCWHDRLFAKTISHSKNDSVILCAWIFMGNFTFK